MPTATKLIAAFCLATLGYVLSEEVKTLFPEGTPFGWFSLLNAAIGVAVGWRVLGRSAGQGAGMAISGGLSAGAALVAVGLFVQASREMVDRAMARRYDGPVEALADIFAIMAEYGSMMLTPAILTIWAVGATLAGVAAEIAARRWR